MTAADYEALEARVAELEFQAKHTVPHKIDAVSFGLGLVHEDVRAFRAETVARFDGIDAALAEIIRRLPAAR